MEAQLTTPATVPAAATPAFVTQIDAIVNQASAFEPLIETLVTQFVPGVALYLPEIKAVLMALLSATHKATGTTAPAPTAPPTP